MGPPRPGKRVRSDELFFDDVDKSLSGSYLKIKLQSGKPIKSKGWPWVQLGVRGILGDTDRLEKASFLSDGGLLVKTKTEQQTEKLLHNTAFAGEECVVVRDDRLNQSRGTIQAYDLLDLSKDEVVRWLREFGVVGARRFTRKSNGTVENTATLLLTFDKPSCPTKLQLDYVTYHVQQYIPNPMMCYRCGRFGHPEVRCQNDRVCLQCGKPRHDGTCTKWCVNCKKDGHSCLARECEVWMKEKDICRIKVEQELSYAQARKQYEATHEPPVLKAYAAVARTPSVASKHEEALKEKVDSLEKRVGEMITLLETLVRRQAGPLNPGADESNMGQAQPAQDADLPGNPEEHREGDADIHSDGGTVDMVQDSAEGSTAPPLPSGSARTEGEWHQAGQGKHKGRNKNKVTSVIDDDISPSPVVTRATKPADKGTLRPYTHRKSWKEDS